MLIIKPLSDLRNKPDEISRICHESGEPIFITKDGKGDMVIMSLARYEQTEARLELYSLLEEAEESEVRGDKGITVAEFRKVLKDAR